MAMIIPQQDEDEVIVEVNTTPLIDVMLVLLIMLIITIPVQLHSVDINMPTGAKPQTAPPPVLRIDIEADGSVRFDGILVAERAELEARIRQVVAQPDQPEVHLRPSRQAPYSVVAMVMANAQRLGVAKLGLVSDGHVAP
ncbi:MAG: biopolymer transport protein ExbD [Pseudomonadota bacterium]|jgi:biopolymer transport protein ExbD